jgi:hypothetical protein
MLSQLVVHVEMNAEDLEGEQSFRVCVVIFFYGRSDLLYIDLNEPRWKTLHALPVPT